MRTSRNSRRKEWCYGRCGFQRSMELVVENTLVHCYSLCTSQHAHIQALNPIVY